MFKARRSPAIHHPFLPHPTKELDYQPSQNVATASDLATYNDISAAFFTLVRLVFRIRLFQVVVHHYKVQIILIKYYHFSYYIVPLITTF